METKSRHATSKRADMFTTAVVVARQVVVAARADPFDAFPSAVITIHVFPSYTMSIRSTLVW